MASELSVLIIEDRAVDAELCEQELYGAGLRFSSTRVWTEAALRGALGEKLPDVILSDFSMPTDLDGFAALGIARALAPDVPFIFVSGTIGEERAVEAMRAARIAQASNAELVAFVDAALPAIEGGLGRGEAFVADPGVAADEVRNDQDEREAEHTGPEHDRGGRGAFGPLPSEEVGEAIGKGGQAPQHHLPLVARPRNTHPGHPRPAQPADQNRNLTITCTRRE